MMDSKTNRCPWCGDDPLYVNYHDEEWGRLVTDDHTLFEFLTLESAQAGLAWITVLRKREGYREAFHNFDVEKVAAMTEEDVERLMTFDGIVKNRRKIQSAITNARLFIEIQNEFGSFFRYLRSFFHGDFPVVNHPVAMADVPVTSPESDAIAKDMKKRGFKFFGSTICYAHLQATGFVDDHLEGCHCKRKYMLNYIY
ncbi:MAG: DNA-3-methyladenine glycosylase I [Clostridiales bacterium]|nr:DNA-3-methyladenine glycosylase I [Clostridiales bacterium]